MSLERAFWQRIELARRPAAELVKRLDPLARRVVVAEVLPVPNPMGLPALDQT